MPKQAGITQNSTLVFRDEDLPFQRELAADLGTGIQIAVCRDELVEECAARLAVPRLVLPDDHALTVDRPPE